MLISKRLFQSTEFPIILSLLVGFILLAIKITSFVLTRSTAVFADLLESIVHLFVVGFAAFSVLFAKKPADLEHHYGHDRIAFFSAGFEGAMILGAALFIFFTLLTQRQTPQHLDSGISLFSLSFCINAALGLYLQKRGAALKNLILTANGKHLLADCVSTAGVVLALVMVKLTGFTLFDPLFAFAVACHILWTGARLLKSAINGLMDRADPKVDRELSSLLERQCMEHEIQFHRLRHRLTGNRIQVDVHLLFPQSLSLSKAHEIATKIESNIADQLTHRVDFVSHLEPLDGHDALHRRLLGRKEDF